jgi:hypothetical protein
MKSDVFTFDQQRCVVLDVEVFPGRWCVGFLGPGSSGTATTKIVESREQLATVLNYFATNGRILVGYNSEKFDLPLIRGILKGIDPYAPAQAIIKTDELPPALTKLPEFPCDHIDVSGRLRRAGAIPSLKVVAARLGRPVLRELPFPPDTILDDAQWEDVKRYNATDLQHTWALLERLAPELQALAELSREQQQDLRSVPSPQVVERVFLTAYRKQHQRPPRTCKSARNVQYQPVQGVVRPRTPNASGWFDRIVNLPIPIASEEARRKPIVPPGRFMVGALLISVGSGGLHSVDTPAVYYATRKTALFSVDVQSFYPSLIADKGIAPAGYGDTGRETYRSLLARRLAVKRAAKENPDPAERDRLTAHADGLKLVLNSFFGKLGDPYSSLYDPSALLAVTLSGQLMLIDLIERLTEAGVKVISANTDGLFLQVPRGDRSWRDALGKWQAETGMSLDIEPLKRLAVLATNQYATRGRGDKVKRKGGELRGTLDWSHSANLLIVNDAVANALLFDIPPERTIFECRELVRFCSIATRGTAEGLMLVDGDAETALPKVTRWYRSKEGSRRIERRFLDGRRVTVPGGQSVTICQDLPESGLPDDLDWRWYLASARRRIQKVPGYRHRSRRRLLGHNPALEVEGLGLLPVPKRGKEQLAGSDVKRPTLLWDWPNCPTVGCYTGPETGTLVLDVDDPIKFRGFVEQASPPLLENPWETLKGTLVSYHGDATPDGVRSGRQRGKLIFKLKAGEDHPLVRVKSRWKKTRGVEVFYGNGLPSILGQYDGNGDRYQIAGTLGEAPEWLLGALLPKQSPPRKKSTSRKATATSPEDHQAALEGLPAVLAELAPELGNPLVGWRRKDVADDREIWVGRCPFEHDSGRSGDADLDAGYHDDGPYVRCLHGSCARIKEINQRLRERHEREHPAASHDPGTDTPEDDSVPWSPLRFSEPPAATPFPVDVFPVPLQDYCRELAEATLAPADFVGVSMLVSAGAAIGQSVNIQLRYGWNQAPLLFAVIVAPPGKAKSPVIRAVVRPLTEIDRRLREESKRAREAWEAAKQAYKDDPDNNPHPGAEPPQERAIVKDVTRESLVLILADNPRGLLCDPDEAAGWVASFNQYKGRGGSDRQFWLSIHTSEPVAFDRKGGRESIYVPFPFVSVLGGLPPDMLTILRDDLGRSDGFLDRILFSYPDSFPRQRWPEKEPSLIAEANGSKTINLLFDVCMQLKEERLMPQLVTLTPDAKSLFIEWFNDHSAEMESVDLPEWQAGPWSKLRMLAARFALILAGMRLACETCPPTQRPANPWTGHITDSTSALSIVTACDVEGARKLVGYFKNHLIRVSRQMAKDSGSADAKVIVDWLRRTGKSTFRASDVGKDLRRFREHPADLATALDALLARGAIRPRKEHRAPSTPGPKPSPCYDVHPDLLRVPAITSNTAIAAAEASETVNAGNGGNSRRFQLEIPATSDKITGPPIDET